MDLQDFIAMALEVVLERERQKKRESEASLWALQVAISEKKAERSVLIRKKQSLLGRQAMEEKLVDDFMVFVAAIENNDLQIAQTFDENEMMNAIVAMLSSNGVDVGENGGFPDDDEGINSDIKNAQNRDIKNAQNRGAVEGTKCDGSEGSDASGNGRD